MTTEVLVILIGFMFFMTTTIFFMIKNGIRKGEIEGLHNTIKKLQWDLYQLQQQKDMEGREEFVRFLDESRDMAFEYIENTQTILLSTIERLNSKTTKKDIKEIITTLETLLPKDK